jgi:tetratricopeptide (TPR) repeat protein
MTDYLTLPPVDPAVIRQALDRIRQAEPVGDNPLKRLVWLRRRLDLRGISPTAVALDTELGESLSALIAENRARLHQVVGAPAEDPLNRQAALETLRTDFSRSNTELEAWSALYYRYVRLDLDLRAREMAQVVGVDPRQLRRRFDHAYRRLAEAISRAERDARAADHHLWMRLKLPPATYTTLFGVDERVARARDLLLADSPPHSLALVGPGGIGKTALAHALSQRFLSEDTFTDLAWLDLNTSAAYPALLSMLAREVGLLHLADGDPSDLEAGLRVRLASTPTLVVLDDADSLDSAQEVIPRLDALVTPGRLLVIMRRRPAPDLPMRLMTVERLPREAMDQLLLDFARVRRSAAGALTPEVLAAIDQAVGGNPLAGRLVVGQMAYLPLDRVMARLGAIPTRGGEGLFDVLFDEAWQSAGDDAHTAAIALYLLPAEGADWSDIRAICGLKPDSLDQALKALAMRSLVEVEGVEPRYVLPSLFRHFVEARSHQPPWRETLERLVKTAHQRLSLEAEPPLSGALTQAMILLHEESELGQVPDDLGERIARVAPSARRSGQWLAWRDLLRYIVDRLEPTGQNRAGLARALSELGAAYRWLGENDLARMTLDEAIAIYGEAGDFAGQAGALLEMGLVYQSAGEREAASAAYQRASSVAERYQSPGIRRRALNGLAALALEAGQPEQALELLQAAMTSGADPLDGQTLSNLGMAHLQLGNPAQAVVCEQQALAVFVEEGDLPRQARTHVRLGMAYHAVGQPDEALFHLGQGLELMRALGDALGQARTLNNLGAVYSADRRFEEALAVWRDALTLQDQLGDRVGMAYTYFNLADLLWKVNQPEAGRDALESARRLADDLGLTSLRAHISAHPLNQA